ncbi:Lactate utilization protein C [Frankia sp. AiPs1]|uniref:LutC/YkgG family protein n=1 Tax=Frankia sp. AiPa1 TaxID=573492 RepID=UPI00202B31F4|nr:LUD domain-containing protein [Frankia sp. AiPa1]MCL9761399.1 LUD domain-containing protein [Frankia sp. AiPa1]
MSAREEILRRVRAANAAAGQPAPPRVPRDYRIGGDHPAGHPELVRRLSARLGDYRAGVVPTAGPSAPEVGAAVRAALTLAGVGAADPVLVPPGLPDGWCPQGIVDDAFAASVLGGFAAVVTGCAAACAETGTLALDGSPGQGRRALTLVPDRHVCVVRAEQVVATVPELLARLDPGRPLTLVSGPSATSDIELHRVEGVHGPRTLVVVLVAPPPPAFPPAREPRPGVEKRHQT